jgi:hypothetical protein
MLVQRTICRLVFLALALCAPAWAGTITATCQQTPFGDSSTILDSQTVTFQPASTGIGAHLCGSYDPTQWVELTSLVASATMTGTQFQEWVLAFAVGKWSLPGPPNSTLYQWNVHITGEASAQPTFVVTGGTGTGYLLYNIEGDTYLDGFSQVSYMFTPPCEPIGGLPCKVPFVFGQPFVIALQVSMDLNGTVNLRGSDDHFDKIMSGGVFGIFDSSGNRVPNAVITAAPEPASLWLTFVGVLVLAGFIRIKHPRVSN